MATVVQNQLSLLEIMKRKKPDGNSIAIAEVLNKKCPVMQDAVWMEANGATYHKFVRRANVPTASKRGFNEGVLRKASATTDHAAQIAIYQNFADIDVELVKIASNPAETRMTEGKAIIEGIGQAFETDLIYGSFISSVNGFEGLQAMLPSGGTNVIDAGGAGGTADCTSVYAVQWGLGKVYCVFPKGSGTMGVEHEDKGIIQATSYTGTSANGDQYLLDVYRDKYTLRGGIVVEDPRCIGRIGSIDSTATIVADDFFDLLAQFRNPDEGGITFYCNRRVWAQIQKLCFGAAAGSASRPFYPVTDPFGRVVSTFQGHPIKLSEIITDTEAEV